jgi:uncharacterized protein (TIGR00661 family)
MKFLYAIQGTGNGHTSRAKALLPKLMEKADVDILVSGIQADVELPFPVLFRKKGLSFIFGKKGGIDFIATLKQADPFRLLKDIRQLKLDAYDLVISDFEPISTWASRLKKNKCLSLSHQSAVLHPSAPLPPHRDFLGKNVLKYYAPSKLKIGFHFERYGPDIFLPIIRSEIRLAKPQIKNHVTVYLPAYSDRFLCEILSSIPNVQWQVFSKHCHSPYKQKNVHVKTIDSPSFAHSMVNAEAVLCGAGFETPAEALFLSKKLMVIPMKQQYEQHCNAAALSALCVPILNELSPASIDSIKSWLQTEQNIVVDYPDESEVIVDRIMELASNGNQA